MHKSKKTKRTQKLKAAKKEQRPREHRGRKTQLPRANLPFSGINYLIFGIGIILLIAGYYFLAQPPSDPDLPPAEGFLSLNIAPILLVLAYIVVFPLGILAYKAKKTPKETNQ